MDLVLVNPLWVIGLVEDSALQWVPLMVPQRGTLSVTNLESRLDVQMVHLMVLRLVRLTDLTLVTPLAGLKGLVLVDAKGPTWGRRLVLRSVVGTVLMWVLQSVLTSWEGAWASMSGQPLGWQWALMAIALVPMLVPTLGVPCRTTSIDWDRTGLPFHRTQCLCRRLDLESQNTQSMLSTLQDTAAWSFHWNNRPQRSSADPVCQGKSPVLVLVLD
mmetsp:Transcript_101693/g.141268  ORF Transcript_101693/g.141268 Transcript_101693/m.141268 type:complete len:216 (-) Transcript_101693:382-1029(-)